MLGTINILTTTKINIEKICEKYLIEEQSHPELGKFVCHYITIDEIINYFDNNAVVTEWQLGCSDWPNVTGGNCFVSWLERGHLCSFSFDYVY